MPNCPLGKCGSPVSQSRRRFRETHFSGEEVRKEKYITSGEAIRGRSGEQALARSVNDGMSGVRNTCREEPRLQSRRCLLTEVQN